MGRTSKGKSGLTGQGEFFADAAMGREPLQASFRFDAGKPPPSGFSRPPDQTNAKSRLIAEYIKNFQLITKGGIYIDGFSGPQSRAHEEAWTARRVLEIAPPRLRLFWLCELDPGGLLQLRSLADAHHGNPKSRRVFVMPGDFNQTVKMLLNSHRLTRGAAIFALLDQRNTECHWATVEALAAKKGRTKIELLYFVGTSWLHRSLASSFRPERLAEIERWWGGPGWRELIDLSQFGLVQNVADRFSRELDYRFVKAYPIYLEDGGNKAAFHLIHASDHPEAPKLMDRAYLKTVGDDPDVIDLRQRRLDF